MFWRLVSGSATIRVGGAAAQLALTWAVSSLYSPEGAGGFFFGYSILVIVASLTKMGSELSGLRETAILIERAGPTLKRAIDSRIILVSGVSIVAALALFGLSSYVGQLTDDAMAPDVLRVVAATIPPLALSGLLAEVLKGAKRYYIAISLQNIAVPGLAVTIIVVAHSLGARAAIVASISVLASSWASAAGGLYAWVLVYRRASSLAYGLPKPSWSRVMALLHEAPALGVVSSASVLMQWVGSAILGFLSSAQDVAGYSVAVRLSIAVSIVHSAAASVVGPQMSIAHESGNSTSLSRVCHQTCLTIFSLTSPVLVLMMIFAPQLMALFGSGYTAYGSVLRVLLAGQLVAAVLAHSGMVLVMTGHYSAARWNSVVSVASLALYLGVLVPLMGVAGAALASALAVATGHIQAAWQVRQRLGLWTIPTTSLDFRSLDLPGLRGRL